MSDTTQIVTITSFRRGTGKTNLLASIGVVAARKGQNVLLVDTAFQSPGLHTLFNISPERPTLTDCLIDNLSFQEALVKIEDKGLAGGLYLLPASETAQYITKLLKEGYDFNQFRKNFLKLRQTLDLDLILIDTQSGLNEDNLILLALSDVVLLLMRTDQQEMQGTAVMVDLLKHLEIPKIRLIVNDLPDVYDPQEFARDIRDAHQCPVAAVLPHANELMTIGSRDILAYIFPNHPITQKLESLVNDLISH
jgi:MinD-like ATPase involved in chromosome partitioning or flagellar assembly